ncbi:MAG TPA: dentin sialophosphoprotein [Marinobacter sp.]|nr:dentin sialophosphoprotein [Marinobacter sp.]
MNTRKNLLAVAIAMSMGISGYAMADLGGDGSPNNNANDSSSANNGYSGNTDSGNDNSLTNLDVDATNNSDNSDHSDNSDNSDNSSSLSDAFKIADSGNLTATDNSDSSDNSTVMVDSNNTDSSDNSDNSATTLNVSLELFMNDAQLSGTVSGSNVTYGSGGGEGAYVDTRTGNEIRGSSANFTGVGAFAQNAGVGSVTQANVSVMSNLSAGGGTN